MAAAAESLLTIAHSPCHRHRIEYDEGTRVTIITTPPPPDSLLHVLAEIVAADVGSVDVPLIVGTDPRRTRDAVDIGLVGIRIGDERRYLAVLDAANVDASA